MRRVVADVTKNSAAVNHDSSIPVVRKEGMGELIERCCEDYE